MLTRRSLLAAGLSAASLEPSYAGTPFIGLAAGDSAPLPRDLVWTSLEGKDVEGRAFADTAAPFDRLPARAEATVPPEVWRLSRHSAGMSVEWESDARALHVRYRLRSDVLAMPHMPATGVSGLDLYGRDLGSFTGEEATPAAPSVAGNATWRWAAVHGPKSQISEATLIEDIDPGVRRWRCYLPLYNGVETLEVGVPPDTKLRIVPPRSTRPIVCYGTSILHGACASRPGMAWPSIVGRRLARPMINLGFSGRGKMELALAELLAEVDAAAYVVDCAPNMSPELIEERAVPFVLRLRESRPMTPIVLVEDRPYGYGWLRERSRARNAGNAVALRAAHTTLVWLGVTELTYVDAGRLLGHDLGDTMTDGSHPNDLGMTRYADALAPLLAAVLRE